MAISGQELCCCLGYAPLHCAAQAADMYGCRAESCLGSSLCRKMMTCLLSQVGRLVVHEHDEIVMLCHSFPCLFVVKFLVDTICSLNSDLNLVNPI